MNDKTDILAKYRNQVICADALEILPRLPDRSIDAVITDPVWPDTSLNLAGGDRAYELWSRAVKESGCLVDGHTESAPLHRPG